jgi:hypothetical protein
MLDVATVVSSRLIELPQRMAVVSLFVETLRFLVHHVPGR